MDIGFIGLGGMGRAMVANLLKTGHAVRVWNRSPTAAEGVVELGARAVDTPREAFAGDAVISMLADDAALASVLDDNRLLDGCARNLIHVNMATISASYAKTLAETHARAGVGYVAAPVLGRVEVAEAGDLNILAAGPASLIERVTPLFDAMGRKVWRFGHEPFRANVAKLAANYMIAATIQTIAEALALGRTSGIEPDELLAVLTGTLFGGRIHTSYGALIAKGQFEPAGLKLALGAKDIRLALAVAEEAHLPMPVAGILRDGFLDAIAHGDEALDWTALSKVTFRHAGLE